LKEHYGPDNDYDDNGDGDGDGEEYGKITGIGYTDTLDGQTPNGEQEGKSRNIARKRKPRTRSADEDTDDPDQLKLPF
jgi:hypothetical protein